MNRLSKSIAIIKFLVRRLDECNCGGYMKEKINMYNLKNSDKVVYEEKEKTLN